jgi:hypothetical protein
MDDLVAFVPQSFHQELANEGIVLDDEYSHWQLLEFLI